MKTKKIIEKLLFCFHIKSKKEKHVEKLLKEALEEENDKRTKPQRGETGDILPIQRKTNFSNTGVKEITHCVN